MKVVLYDAIQESHVADSLERALLARGHEVYSTGRFGAGYAFRDVEELRPVVEPHLNRVTEFGPDLVLVFRPASAPYPILQALRSTGAVLMAWFSDDPVLYQHSYGPVVELYDLILHCGTEEVLHFYEEQFGRPTGVNFPFWTDHVAFPAVYGELEPEYTVMFLGNVVGPLRQGRYEQLAAMRQGVRIFGRVGDDPAGLAGGFLDTDDEVVQAARRARVAVNIPQLFADHRGQPTWFPGIESLSHFDLPSRVIQYSALGLPTVSVVPGAPPSRSFPELVVCPDIAAADRWITDALHDGRLPELGAQAVDRFDRSFSAASRVLALESLMEDDRWRQMDSTERAVWFHRFDGRTVQTAGADGLDDRGDAGRPEGIDLPVRVDGAMEAGAPLDVQTSRADIAVVHACAPRRFDTTDVILRELRHAGRLATASGPEDRMHTPSCAASVFETGLDAQTLLGAVAPGALTAVILIGTGLSGQDAEILRQAGVVSIGLVGPELLAPVDAEHLDLVVRVGQPTLAEASALRGLDHAVFSPGLVESDFLELVSNRPVQSGAALVCTSHEPMADAVREAVPGPHREFHSTDLEAMSLETLADALARPVVYLQPARMGRRRQVHPVVLPYALCAGERVVTARHGSHREPDMFGQWLTQAADVRELEWKLEIQDSDARVDRRQRHVEFDARAQIEAWIDRAREGAALQATERADRQPLMLSEGTPRSLALGTRYPIDPGVLHHQPGETTILRLRWAGSDLVQGVRLLIGDRGLGEQLFAPGSTPGAEIVLLGAPAADQEQLSVELIGEPTHRLRSVTRLRTRLDVHRGRRPAGDASSQGLTAYVLPAEPARSASSDTVVDRRAG